MSKQIDTNIIRAYDIRGIYNENLTPEIMAKIGFLLGEPDKEIVVGNDIRSSGIELAKALISGLLAKKSKVYYSGTGPYGQILFSGLGKDKILFITASHLTKEWNGLKLYYGNGIPFSCEEISKLKEDILKLKEIPVIENVLELAIKLESKEKYKKFIKEKFKLKKIKIIIDCRHGSTALVIPEILKDLNHEIISINNIPDPTFNNESPKVDPEFIQELKQKVIKQKADIGMAFDGDGDRVSIVDERGRILSGNEVGALLGKYYSESKSCTIINTISCSMISEKILKKNKSNIITVPVGHTFVGIACKKYNAILGYEESGHVFLPEYFYFDDALIVPLKIIEIMQKKNKKLSELADEIPIYPFLEKSFVADDSNKFEIMKNITNKIKQNYINTNDMDGIKVIFNDGWALIRCSNTNPKIRLYVESTTEKRLKELEMIFTKVIENEQKSIMI